MDKDYAKLVDKHINKANDKLLSLKQLINDDSNNPNLINQCNDTIIACQKVVITLHEAKQQPNNTVQRDYDKDIAAWKNNVKFCKNLLKSDFEFKDGIDKGYRPSQMSTSELSDSEDESKWVYDEEKWLFEEFHKPRLELTKNTDLTKSIECIYQQPFSPTALFNMTEQTFNEKQFEVDSTPPSSPR